MERISPITGRPVRKYIRRKVKNVIIEPVIQPLPIPEVKGAVIDKFTIYDLIKCKKFNVDGNYSNVYITDIATMNCQIAVAGSFHSLLNGSKNLIEDLKVIRKNCNNRNILLVDIGNNILKTLKKKLDEKYIMMISPYVSTNGSKMNICLINMRNL